MTTTNSTGPYHGLMLSSTQSKLLRNLEVHRPVETNPQAVDHLCLHRRSPMGPEIETAHEGRRHQVVVSSSLTGRAIGASTAARATTPRTIARPSAKLRRKKTKGYKSATGKIRDGAKAKISSSPHPIKFLIISEERDDDTTPPVSDYSASGRSFQIGFQSCAALRPQNEFTRDSRV